MHETGLKQHIEKKVLYESLIALDPKPVTLTVPENATENKELFLRDEIDVPQHHYPKMELLADDLPLQIRRIGEGFHQIDELDGVEREVYDEFVENFARRAELLQTMNRYRHAPLDEKEVVAAEFMRRNIELYGEPDKETYLSLVSEVLAKANGFAENSEGNTLAQEVMDVLQIDTRETVAHERFRPSPDTMEWMQNVVKELYGGMLAHVPDGDNITPETLKETWMTILKEEFGDVARDWKVLVEPAKSINVRSMQKEIVIPVDRKPMSSMAAKKLTVHEIGVHVMRAITGGSTNIDPLAHGIAEYYDTEEGLGVIMEQALVGEYREAGVAHYITAGMAYHNGLNFRETFEMRWRLNAINDASMSGDLTEAQIAKARSSAYSQVMRIFRGTDELPWFKDLAYYNGSAHTWQYLEGIRDDEFMLSLLLQGKCNTSHKHQSIILESKTVA